MIVQYWSRLSDNRLLRLVPEYRLHSCQQPLHVGGAVVSLQGEAQEAAVIPDVDGNLDAPLLSQALLQCGGVAIGQGDGTHLTPPVGAVGADRFAAEQVPNLLACGRCQLVTCRAHSIPVVFTLESDGSRDAEEGGGIVCASPAKEVLK